MTMQELQAQEKRTKRKQKQQQPFGVVKKQTIIAKRRSGEMKNEWEQKEIEKKKRKGYIEEDLERAFDQSTGILQWKCRFYLHIYMELLGWF